MTTRINVKEYLRDHLAEGADFQEFLFFCLARQGGRTALEILARALISQGKNVFVGQNLTGARSVGTNHMVMRIGDTPDLPRGMAAERPTGIMFLHEALVWPDPSEVIAQVKRSEGILATRKGGLLMISTARAPKQVAYPIDFTGTVATVDAEAVFADRVDIRPAPSGITALGLFAAANRDLLDIEALKASVLQHDRLSPRVRQLNAECMEEAYERAKVARRVKLKGKMTPAEFEASTVTRPTTAVLDSSHKGISTEWREELPVLDDNLCTCEVCFSAMACPEAVIRWHDGAIHMDYSFCKGCGSCANECPPGAITMDIAESALARWEAENPE
jgi:2-oxoacid:acceptor oxidoreductase delta subunit (pyruvate/2-ketoisovalerate family)